jgi:hypothetical protein
VQRDNEQPETEKFNTELVRYQLSELKVITEQGFIRMEGRLAGVESRLSGLEVWKAKTEAEISGFDSALKTVNALSETRNSQGMGAIAKIALTALGILSALVGVLTYVFQRGH